MSEVRKSAAAYLIAVVLCLAFLTGVLKLWKADASVPLRYGGDAILYQFWVKGVVDNGWYLNNDFVGAPFRLEMHDFPLSDGLFFLALKGLSCFTRDYARVLNVYFLLTFPAVTVSALFVFRRFGAARGPAVVGAVLFALLPYHFLRGEEHLFLASYFLVPLAVMVVLRVYLDAGPGGRRAGDPGTWAGLALCLLIGSGGVYYAFFTSYLLLVAGASAALWRRRARPLRAAVVAVAAVSASVLVNVAPKFLYAMRHGPNPEAVVRETSHAEVFGLKLVQLLLPVSGHRLGLVGRLRDRYDTAMVPLLNENATATLGLVAALGFLALVLGLFRRRSRGDAGQSAWGGLVDLNLAAVLLATWGGFGTLFGLLVTPWIRGYCRMSVFIAFFSLFAAVLGLTKLDRLADTPTRRRLWRAALGAVLVAGVFDQTSPSFVPDYASVKQEFTGDAGFVGRIEASLPPRAMVFQLPYSNYPEPKTVERMMWYEHLRGYLHSKTLRWSYGAMRGRYADVWQARVAEQAPDAMVRRLALAGFGGIYLDRTGYADAGSNLREELTYWLGVEPLVSRDGRFFFFDLTGYADSLRRELAPTAWAAEREAALHPVLASWGPGFYGREEGPTGPFRWSSGLGEITLTNPSPGPRRGDLAMILSTLASEPSSVQIKGPGGKATVPVDDSGREVRRTVVVPPGVSRLRFTGNGPRVNAPNDPRTLVFRVEGLTIEEPGGVAGVPEAEAVRR